MTPSGSAGGYHGSPGSGMLAAKQAVHPKDSNDRGKGDNASRASVGKKQNLRKPVKMRAIIPAAGIGKRMRPLTDTRPKALLPLAGRPIIGHLITEIIETGIHSITVVVGYYAEKVEQYCLDAFPEADFRFCLQEKRLGLGHAIREAISQDDREILVIYGDTLFDGDLSQFSGEEAALGVVKVNDPERFGIADVKDGKIVHLAEKPSNPTSNLALGGVNYFPDAQEVKTTMDELIERDIRTKGEYQITDAMQMMIERGTPFRAIELPGWYDCGVPETLLETNRVMFALHPELNSVPDSARENNTIIEPAAIDESAELSESTIGPNVHIGPGCRIKRCRIADSIVDGGAKLEGMNISRAVVGEGAMVQPGIEGEV